MVDKKGFTIIEVLVAILIFSIGILAMAALFPMGMRVSYRAQMRTKALSYAMGKIEELRSLPFTDSALTAGEHTEGNLENRFELSWEVTDDVPLTGMKYVKVYVKWLPPAGDTEQIELETYLARLN